MKLFDWQVRLWNKMRMAARRGQVIRQAVREYAYGANK